MRNPRLILLTACIACIAAGRGESRNAFYGIASRGTTAVAAGDSGRIIFSPQAPHVAWFGANHATVLPLRAVCIGASDYVAVGEGGQIYRSMDASGVSWLPRSSHTDLDLFGVHNTPTRIVAVGDSGVIMISASLSTDNWTAVENLPTRRTLRAVTAGVSIYAVAVGDSGTILWSPASSVAAWYPAEVVPTTANLRGVTIGPGASPRFWAVGDDGVILRSIPNAREWEAIFSPVTTRLHGVAFEGSIGVAVGDGGTVLYSNGGEIWSPVQVPTGANLYAVAYTGSGAGGAFVAVGEENTVIWSAVGLVWEQKTVPVRKTTWGGIRGRW
jgi:photosystem II stability/assembly factor-like uncharacterized protein